MIKNFLPINYANISIKEMVLHRVGHKQTNQKNFISEATFSPNNDVFNSLQLLYKATLQKAKLMYQFSHSVALEYNEMYDLVQEVFLHYSTRGFLEFSQKVVQHLYNKSDHPSIKNGDVHVVYLSDIIYGDEIVDGIAIFKSEIKSNFLRTNDLENRIEAMVQSGVAMDKMDKGALILNINKEDGYRVLSVDNNNYDALYWNHHFLGIDVFRDENFLTSIHFDMVQNLVNQEMKEYDVTRRFEVLQDAKDYFGTQEEFVFEDFCKAICPDEEVKDMLLDLRASYDLEDVDSFELSHSHTKEGTGKIKRKFRTDTGITINLGDAEKGFYEKGYDEDRGMYYFKVLFNEEKT